MLMYSVDVISVACSKQGSVIWVDSRQSEEHSYTHACTYVITYSKNARTFVYKEARLIARLLYKKKYVGVSILHNKCVCMCALAKTFSFSSFEDIRNRSEMCKNARSCMHSFKHIQTRVYICMYLLTHEFQPASRHV